MNVYLVPTSPTRFCLYSEAATSIEPEGAEAPRSWFGRMQDKFRRAVDEGEKAEAGEVDDAGQGRVRRVITRKLAEAVAEQRLLWRLRHETAVSLFHPETVTPVDAVDAARTECERDYLRHRRWLVIDGLIVAITGPLFFFVPGPNLVSWYFTFRAVGHFFSMVGARRALREVTWTPEPSPPLTAVAGALALDLEGRREQLAAAAEALGLRRLPAFVERVRRRSA